MILFALSLAWLFGLVAAALGAAWLGSVVMAIAIGAAVAFLLKGQHGAAALLVAAGVLALAGSLRFDSRVADSTHQVALYEGKAGATFSGTVVTEPDSRGKTQRFQLRLESVNGVAAADNERILVTTRPFPRFEYGDRLKLSGKIAAPKNFSTGFDYRDYLAGQGITAVADFPRMTRVGEGGGDSLHRALWSVRRPLAAAIERALPQPEAALGEGMLLGLRADIPKDVTDDFNAAGISHIVAISGYNVTLVAGLTLALLTWPLGRRRGFIGAALAVIGFVLLVGATPSVFRAGFMGLLALGAGLAGRPGHGATALAFSAAALTALSPRAIEDVSFQLSFAATAGLVFLAPATEALLGRVGSRLLPPAIAAPLASSLGVTIAASVAALPIIGLTFGRISVVSLPANLVAVPLAPVILVTTAVTAIGGAISPALGEITGRVAVLPLTALIAAGRIAASLPGATRDVTSSGTWLLVAPFVVVGLALSAASRLLPPAKIDRPRPINFSPAVAAVLIALLAAGVASDLIGHASGRLEMIVLDVPGSAALVRTPDGRRILIADGVAADDLDRSLAAELGRDRRIDLAVLPTLREDDVQALAAIASRYDVRAALLPAAPGRTAGYRALRELLDQQGANVRLAADDVTVDLGHGVRMDTIAGASGVVQLRIVDGEVSALIWQGAGGRDFALDDRPQAMAATVLVVPMDAAVPASFVDTVRPQVAVRAGASDALGPAVPLGDAAVFSVGANGRIALATDGQRIWASPARGGFEAPGVAAAAGR